MNVTNATSNLYNNTTSSNKNTDNSNSNFNVDTKIMNEINNESDTVEREEDTILYQQLKAAGVDFTSHSLEWQKEAIQSFPPLTAPANVRRSYRETLENASPEEKKAASALPFYMYIYQTQTGDKIDSTSNSVSGYSKLLENFKNYFQTNFNDDNARYKVDVKSTSNFIDNLLSKLSQYSWLTFLINV